VTPRRGALSLPALLLALAALVTACGGSGDPAGPGGTVDSLPALPRALSASEQAGVAAGNDFSLRLLQQAAATRSGNLLLSPLSVSVALGLTMNGAEGQTLDQMRSTLGWGARPRAEVNTAYRDLMALLPTLDSTVVIRTANGIWLRAGYTVDAGFAADAQQFFGAPIRTAATPQAMFDAVNAWGNEQTLGLVPRVLDTPPPDDLLVLLANAVYFNGAWRDRFDPTKTQPGPFRLESGQQVTVPLMKRSGRFRGWQGDGLVAAELAYGNSAYQMLLLKPESGTVGTLAARLDTALLGRVVRGLGPMGDQADVVLPRFKVAGSLELKPDLEAMGMPRAFSDAAQFPRLIQEVASKLVFVRHGVSVEVDERGTRAAAVTVVGGGPTSMPPNFRFDQPFIFLIRERFAGTVLFAGVVRDPRAT
jgi:serpin B